MHHNFVQARLSLSLILSIVRSQLNFPERLLLALLFFSLGVVSTLNVRLSFRIGSSHRYCSMFHAVLMLPIWSYAQVGLIGPATVGGIKPGCMRIGKTGGMLDNIVMSKVR